MYKLPEISEEQLSLLVHALTNAANEFDHERNQQFALAKETRELRSNLLNNLIDLDKHNFEKVFNFPLKSFLKS
jgi:restriction endonuclease Mrr